MHGFPASPSAISVPGFIKDIRAKPYIHTVIIDNTGRDMDFAVGVDSMKAPRGILDYKRGGTEINWKITGNLGGEDFQDRVRGPTNEAGSYPKRQGWHQPQPPSAEWKSVSPVEGVAKPGAGFFTTEFDLDIPEAYDVLIDVLFKKSDSKHAKHDAYNYHSQGLLLLTATLKYSYNVL